MQQNTYILKSASSLKLFDQKAFQSFIKVSKTHFWRNHFSNKDFSLNILKLDWDLWQKIPFFRIEDYTVISFEERLKDARKQLSANAKRFVLRVPLRKIRKQNSQLLLFLELLHKRTYKNKIKGWELQQSDSFAINLRRVLSSLQPGADTKLLIINNSHDFTKIALSIEDIPITSLSVSSRYWRSIATAFGPNRAKQISQVSFNIPIKFRRDLQKAKEDFTSAKFITHFPLVDIGYAIRSCEFAQRKFGSNTVHPKRSAIIELRNLNSAGYGEVVVSSFSPPDMAWLRYRTGILGKANSEKCECGSGWNLILKNIISFKLTPPKMKFK